MQVDKLKFKRWLAASTALVFSLGVTQAIHSPSSPSATVVVHATAVPTDIQIPAAAEVVSSPESDFLMSIQGYSQEQLNSLWIHAIFGPLGDQAEKLLRLCENPDLSSFKVSATQDYGLFQVHAPDWRAAFTRVTGQSWDKIFDPWWNTVFAKWLNDQTRNKRAWNGQTGDFNQWSCQHVLRS